MTELEVAAPMFSKRVCSKSVESSLSWWAGSRSRSASRSALAGSLVERMSSGSSALMGSRGEGEEPSASDMREAAV